MKDLSPKRNANIVSLLKILGLLLLIVILFSLLSRYLFGSGMTLREYADSRAEESQSSESGGETLLSEPGSTSGTVPESVPESASGTAPESVPESVPGTAPESVPETADIPAAETEAVNGLLPGTLPEENPICTVYQDGFYYEPLGGEVIEYITGTSYPADGAEEISYEDLRYVHVLHYDFNGETAHGELICNQAIAQDLVEIFYELYLAEYRIEKIRLIENYDGDDNASMEDNNTSCFNYRPVTGQDNLSRHALGLAVDINPFYNPYIRGTQEGGRIVLPEGSETYADRSLDFPYKIDSQDLCCRLFLEHGFIWGGNWNSVKDYQHFQKTPD